MTITAPQPAETSTPAPLGAAIPVKRHPFAPSPLNKRRWQNFKANRRGYWAFWIFLVLFAISLLANFIATLLAEIVGGILNAPIGEFYTLAVLFPATCLAARRLQDTGRNGMLAWVLLILIAVTQIAGILMALSFFFVGFLGMLFLPGLSILGLLTLGVGVVLIWFWCQPGDAGPNAYGPVPPVFDPSKPSIVT